MRNFLLVLSLCLPPPATAQTCARALVLVPGRAQFSTMANRALYDNAPTAGYDPDAGPGKGVGAVTFDATLMQYLDGGAHTFNIERNWGFTAVIVLKPQSTGIDGEDIISFGTPNMDDETEQVFVFSRSIWNNQNLWSFSMADFNMNSCHLFSYFPFTQTWTNFVITIDLLTEFSL